MGRLNRHSLKVAHLSKMSSLTDSNPENTIPPNVKSSSSSCSKNKLRSTKKCGALNVLEDAKREIRIQATSRNLPHSTRTTEHRQRRRRVRHARSIFHQEGKIDKKRLHTKRSHDPQREKYTTNTEQWEEGQTRLATSQIRVRF